MTQNAASVANIKGVANQTALLKWLDASNLYNGNLDINQITIDTAVSGTGLQWNDSGSDINSYTVTLIPIANSNMYTGTIKVKFNVGRIDFNLATIIEMDAYYGGSLPENPTNSEIFN
jgi:hypothetical protein